MNDRGGFPVPPRPREGRGTWTIPDGARSIVLVLLTLALAAPLALLAASPTPSVVIRVFSLKHRRAEEAAILVRPFRTDGGSLVVESKLNTITITDAANAIDKMAQVIASYDVPPRGVSIAVTLLRASNEAPKSPERRDVSEEVRGAGERIKRLFNYVNYVPLDSVVFQGTEGDSLSYAIGGDFHVDFTVESTADDAVLVRNLTLERIRRDERGQEVRKPIGPRSSLRLTIQQTVVYGVAREEASSNALFLVFYATWRGPGPGIAGVR